MHPTPPTPEDIRATAGLIRKIRPAFSPIIHFYEALFTAQEESRLAQTLSPVTIEPDLLTLKLENQMPLIDPSQFPVDMDQAAALFRTACGLAMAHAPQMAGDAETLLDRMPVGDAGTGDAGLGSLFSAVLESRQPDLEAMAGTWGVPVQTLLFFAVSAMAPSLAVAAEQLAVYLNDTPPQKKGYCPICGSHPEVAFLDKDGKKHLVCSLCSHSWQTRRMGCSFCDSTDTRLQHYFYSNEEKEYRVYLCDNCNNYLKVVDLRELDRTFIPKLEQIASLHLDYKAREKGYTHATLGKDTAGTDFI